MCTEGEAGIFSAWSHSIALDIYRRFTPAQSKAIASVGAGAFLLDARARRKELGGVPSFQSVDTCAAKPVAETPYLFVDVAFSIPTLC